MKKIRLSFDVPPETKKNLEALQANSNSVTLAELFRNAMALYEVFLSEQNANTKIVFEKANGQREVLRSLKNF